VAAGDIAQGPAADDTAAGPFFCDLKHRSSGLVSGLDEVQAVMRVLEAEGVEFLNHGGPGVKLRRKDPV
jgi:hypothetical protein